MMAMIKNLFLIILLLNKSFAYTTFSFKNNFGSPFISKGLVSKSAVSIFQRQTPEHVQRTESQLRRLLRFASITVPPPAETTKKTGGDGEDGLHFLNREQCMNTIYEWYTFMPNSIEDKETSAVYGEMMSLAIKLDDPANMRTGYRRYGKSRHRQIALAWVKSKKVRSIAYCELRTDTSVNTGPPHFIVKLIGLSPDDQNDISLGLELIKELKSFSFSNAMMIEMDMLWKYKHSRVLALEGSLGMKPDSSVYKEQDSNYALVQEYKRKIKVPMVVIPSSVYGEDNTDLGSYWYEGMMNDGVRFYIRQRPKDQSEFDFSLDWPWVKASGTQLTGTGSVRNPTVVDLQNIAEYQDSRLKQPELQQKAQSILNYIAHRFSLDASKSSNQ